MDSKDGQIMAQTIKGISRIHTTFNPALLWAHNRIKISGAGFQIHGTEGGGGTGSTQISLIR